MLLIAGNLLTLWNDCGLNPIPDRYTNSNDVVIRVKTIGPFAPMNIELAITEITNAINRFLSTR